MEERSLHIVIVGHVDHGKSTLVGRLFHDTGSLPPEKLEEIKRACEALGKPFEFAYIMDNLEEERTKGITIDIAHTFFNTLKRRYVIIDAPGHKEFLKNMISGTSQADSALLLIDVSRGIEAQTLRHCYILSLLGVTQVAVLVNKMDLCVYGEERFNEVKEGIEVVLARHKVVPEYVIPISAANGDNVATRSANMPWYKGPTVLGALDSFEPLKIEEKGLRFPVQDVYDVDGVRLAVGRVESGVLKAGSDVTVMPGNTRGKIMEIRKYLENEMSEAHAGDCVGIRYSGVDLKRGDVVSTGGGSYVTKRIHANIFWMVEKDYVPGIKFTFRCATQEVRGTIDKIYKRFDPATESTIESDLTTIRPAEVAEVDILLEGPVAVDAFSEVPELGRFVLEHAETPVAGGIII